jgi:hypothetical protein
MHAELDQRPNIISSPTYMCNLHLHLQLGFILGVLQRRSKTNKIKKEDKEKVLDMSKGKALESTHYIVSHCNIGVTKDLFNTSSTSWRDP